MKIKATTIRNILKPKNKEISNEVITLALPVIVSNLSRVLMSVADVAMVGRLGPAALAATGMGAMLFWGVLSFVLGIRTATQTLASRRLGQEKFSECSTAFHNGMFMATVYGLPMSGLGYFMAEKYVPFFIQDSHTSLLCIEYSSIVFAGLFFSSLGFVFQGFFTGVEKTKIHMNVSIISNVINVYLNVGLIYGTEGVVGFFSNKPPFVSWIASIWSFADFPALGVKGAAIATLAASTWVVLHYCAYLFGRDLKEKYKIWTFKLNMDMMKRQVRLALPQGSQEMAVALGWSMYYKIMGMIGLLELATTELIFTIMHASFMPAMGVGQACATLVGKYMGKEEIEKAERSIWESVRWSEIIMGTMGLTFFIIPEIILSIFTNDHDVIKMGVFGLRALGLLQVVDAMGFTFWFALSGAGNTFFPAMVESGLLWGIMLPVSYYTGVILEFGFYGPWLTFPVYLIFFAGILFWKIRKGDWKEIQL